MSKVSNQLLVIGLILVVVTFGLNIYNNATAAAGQSEAWFSTNWWARWFPLYGTGGALMLASAVLRRMRKERE
ncbi:hypothetical protein [Paenalcaligenes suwonensis]|uniref:hypothetical protein n=1 Tax=Paenalcaligenes suwonensis TaxID=1202713 RepID=UPI00140B1071|nr:hypothetical protein [Paenalcaligenes suwonensis]NHC59984.1 hypothetical protein [Paenalcaligenes suwonensis]